MVHELLTFITKWSPHIWLFGSLFGILLSGSLYQRSRRIGTNTDMQRFWRRHALWFLYLHASFVYVGVVTVFGFRSDWFALSILFVLLAIPLVLVYRSYDSLRVGGKDD